MAIPMQKLREIIFQMLYSYDLGKSEDEDIIKLMMKELSASRSDVITAHQKVEEIAAIFPELDSMIKGASFSYDFNRIHTVERNILRLAVFEMFFSENIPPKVAMSEAVRLTRKFSTPEAANFVNAILDTLYKAANGKEVDINNLTKSIEELSAAEEKAKEVPKDAEEV